MALHCPDYERSVQEIVLLFATCLGDEQTPVTSSPEHKAPFVQALGTMLRTDWIVGTQDAELKGVANRLGYAAPNLD
jgi:hypothetical protein